jgi:hypothetical protein
MSRSLRAGACALAVLVAAPLLSTATPATAAQGSVASTNLGSLVRAQTPNGSAGLLGATATVDLTGAPAADQFLGGALLQDDSLKDAWVPGGYLGAWLAPEHPEPAGTFKPEIDLNEQLLFEATYTGGPAVGAGDRAGFNLAVLPYAPLSWDRDRADADGELTWGATTLAQQTSSTFDGATAGLDSFMFRAEVVASGGDVDARQRPVTLPPLVLDLPRSYESGSRYTGMTAVATPYTTYFDDFRMAVLPELGKMILTAQVSGYIPEGRTTELPNGSKVNDWHLPLTGVVAFATSGEGEPSAQMELPAGGEVFDLATGRVNEFAPGDSLVATSAGTSSAHGAPGETTSASSSLQDAFATAELTRTSTEPLHLDLTSGFSLTVDPSHDGTGILTLKNVRSERLGESYADLVSIPAVRIGDEDVMLTSDKLVGLRALPFRNGGGVGVGLNASFTDGGNNQSLWNQARFYKSGFLLDARYLVDGIVVNVQHQLFHQGVPDGGRLNVIVDAFALDGRVIDAYPLASGLLSGGTVRANATELTTETSIPSARVLEVGPQRIDATFRAGFGALRSGTTTVLTQPAPFFGRPPDAVTSITDVPLAITITPPTTVIGHRNTLTTLRFGLVKGAGPDPAPSAIGEACHGVQINDGPAPDAPPSYDITAAWFESDDVNLYLSMQAADVPAPGAPLPVRYSTYFWHEHTQYLIEASQANGVWSYRAGLGQSNFTAPVDGEVIPGPSGIVRVTVPRDFFDLASGELLRDTSTHSFTAGNNPVDSAPQGSSTTFGSGGDYEVAPCKPSAEIVETVLQLATPDPVQYSDDFFITGTLTDGSGQALAHRSVSLTMAGQSAEAVTHTLDTMNDGTFTLGSPATMAPGTYEVTATFAGEDDAYSPDSAVTALTVLHEDARLSLTVDGKGNKGTLGATLYDPDDLSAIAGREITFYADGVWLGSGVTDGAGRAVFDLPPRFRGGHHDFEAVFSGDALYLGAAAASST